MADTTVKNVKVVVAGEASGAKTAFTQTEQSAGAAASKIKEHFAGVFSALSNNPALSQFTEAFAPLTSVFDNLGGKADTLHEKIGKIGLVGAGVGGALTMMGQADQQSAQQLAQAFKDAGFNIDDYKDKVEHTAGSMAKFGYTSSQTNTALQTLVQATGDPTKAFNDMSVAANLAAAKHEDLGTAAEQVAQILNGKGTKSLAQFGITVTKTKKGTTDYQAVLDELSKKVSGQASAASDTFTGKLKALRAEVENHVAEFGQKYGPTITAAGAGLTVLSHAADGAKSVMNLLRGGTEAAAGAQELLTGAQATGEVAADGLAAGETAADAAGLPLILTIGLIVAAIALVVLGIYELVKHWHTVFEDIKGVIDTVVNFIKAHWQLLLEILLAPIAPVLAIFLAFHTQIIGFFQKVLNFVEGVPGAIIGFFTGLPDKIMSTLSGLLDKLVSFGENIITSIVHGIGNMGSAIWDEIKKHIPGGGVIGSALGAIGLAEGGIVTKPTLAMIGEAGYPEAVIPLRNGASVMGFNDAVSQLQGGMFSQPGQQTGQAGTTTNQVSIQALTNADPTAIATEVTWALQRMAA